jgi:acetyl-CoA C-acetyltransferase
MYRSVIDEETYNQASMVNNPLNLFDIAPHADGAAALILTRSELLPPNFPHPLVRITGSAMANDRLALHDRQDLLDFQAARVSVQRACAQAGITPGEIDFFELFDAYSIMPPFARQPIAHRGEG